jgi:glycosyltransferase involved in cell wall biosynthesis
LRFATIAHAGQLAHARVLAKGLQQHHPESRLTVLVAGPDDVGAEGEPFQVLRPEELRVTGWERLSLEGRWPDLTEFFKPHLLSRLIAEGAEASVYLNVTVDVRAPLGHVARMPEDQAGVIAPRVLVGLPDDGRRPNEDDLRRAGRLGASMVALGRHPIAVELVGWWAERLTRAARLSPAGSPALGPWPGRALSYWIDLAPSVFDGVALLEDPGSAVSAWNLHERGLGQADGALTVDGRPLRFIDFEGFDPYRPFLLDPDLDRVRAIESPELAELCDSYAERLRAAGWRDPRRRSEVGRRLANGMVFDDRLSHLLAEASAAGAAPADLFTEDGTEAFMKWMAAPSVPGSAGEVSRYLSYVHREREDLARAYPDPEGADSQGFAGWSWVFGVREMGLPERFLPPRPAGIDAATVRGPAAEPARGPGLPRGPRPGLSMNVTGLLKGTLGLGEAARGYVRALGEAGIPVSTSTVDIREFVTLTGAAHETYAQVDFTDLEGEADAGFNLVCINADELIAFADSAAEGFFRSRPTIGVWAWETDAIPQRWNDAYGLLDEIWVYSRYVAHNIAAVAPIPVKRVPPPVSPPDPGDLALALGVPAGFQFLFMFDFFSTIQRKNPVGLINAFRNAFKPGEGPQLVIKTINGVHRPEALEEVLWAARGRDDIHVVDRSLSARERDALVAGCDCYVSLHRSEGFGLTLAECMALGKPVIGTDYSATTDFMTPENSYPVSYELTRVGADCEIYPAEGTWAEPDTGEAASAMRSVFERPDEARAKGELARRRIEELYSPRAVGELIRSRLEELAALWR